VPDGVREAPARRGQVELRMHGPHLPPLRDIARAVRPTAFQISEREVADDWRERRLADYQAQPIAGRLIVRPRWAPAAPEGMIDIVLEEGGAFGAGTHPTTRKCLELMLDMTPGGSFADLGCGSGVLAILAGLLGFSPLTAFDVQPGSVEATRVNAARAGVEVQAGVADLSQEPAPPAQSFVANVPPLVHAGIAASWHAAPEPRAGLISGFGPAHADGVAEVYAACGFTERERHVHHGWVVAELARA
jgi:ribosomal protein L11 methyltransferase